MTNCSSYSYERIPNSKTIMIINIDKSKDVKQKIWEKIRECVAKAQLEGHSKIILCTKTELFENSNLYNIPANVLEEVEQLNAKILIINADNADLMVPVSSQLIWFDYCSAIGLAVIFKSCYPLIQKEEKMGEETIDEKLCQLTSNKFMVYPLQKTVINRISKTEKLNERIERLIKQSDIFCT